MAVLLGSLVKYLNGRCNARVLLRSPEFPLSFPFWLLFDSVWFLSSPVISADRYRRIFFLFYTRHSDNEALGFLTGRKRLREGVGHCCIEPIELFFYIINLTIEARRKRGRDAYKQKRLWVIDVQVTRCLTAADPRQPFSPQTQAPQFSPIEHEYQSRLVLPRRTQWDILMAPYRSSACVHLAVGDRPQTLPSRPFAEKRRRRRHFFSFLFFQSFFYDIYLCDSFHFLFCVRSRIGGPRYFVAYAERNSSDTKLRSSNKKNQQSGRQQDVWAIVIRRCMGEWTIDGIRTYPHSWMRRSSQIRSQSADFY